MLPSVRSTSRGGLHHAYGQANDPTCAYLPPAYTVFLDLVMDQA
jgi:hypothetical protein